MKNHRRHVLHSLICTRPAREEASERSAFSRPERIPSSGAEFFVSHLISFVRSRMGASNSLQNDWAPLAASVRFNSVLLFARWSLLGFAGKFEQA